MRIILFLTNSEMKLVNRQPKVYPVVTTESNLAESEALSLMSKYWNKVVENTK